MEEIIVRTINPRNGFILELMARGGMRIGKVLKRTAADVDERRLPVRDPKSGKEQEAVFIPQLLADRRSFATMKNIRAREGPY